MNWLAPPKAELKKPFQMSVVSTHVDSRGGCAISKKMAAMMSVWITAVQVPEGRGGLALSSSSSKETICVGRRAAVLRRNWHMGKDAHFFA